MLWGLVSVGQGLKAKTNSRAKFTTGRKQNKDHTGLCPVRFRIFATGMATQARIARTTNQWNGWNSSMRFSMTREERLR